MQSEGKRVQSIEIPARLKRVLPDGSFIHPFLATIEKIVAHGLELFPNYTIHDVGHINQVLINADQLIPDEVLEKLDPLTVEVLVAACALHDLGMFIRPDGLGQLIFRDQQLELMPHLDTQTWRELWDDYYLEIQHFSTERLKDVFGTSDPPCVPRAGISTTMPDQDRRTYGEFVRKYHPRLAHEMIIHGFFGAGDESQEILDPRSCPPGVPDLIGLIARSHGMPMRDTTEFLETYEKFDNGQLPLGVPVYYVMALLRLADYLDAGSERAPYEWPLMEALNSTTSSQEFQGNQAINGRFTWEKLKKRVSIAVDPRDGATFRHVESMITSVQHELDLSWAVLDEMYYGAYPLSIHRVTSNILDPERVEGFNKRFATRSMALRANPDVLRLLVGPLYNYEPSYGVRELLQNAVDACRERTALEEDAGNTEYVGTVRVELNTEEPSLTITDNGVGMTEKVIADYYLSAGSSYRYSEEWAKNYVGEDGQPTVARTGRFGIGVLATFLLGDKVTVTTRNIHDELGYTFTLTQVSAPLEVTRVRDAPVGTTIHVTMTKKTVRRLLIPPYYYVDPDGLNSEDLTPAWTDWYYWERPRVDFFVDGSLISNRNIQFIPTDPRNLTEWKSMLIKDYSSCFWHCAAGKSNRQPVVMGFAFVCNGMVIENHWLQTSRYGYDIGHVGVSVTDENNRIQLNLKRDKVIEFEETEHVVEEAYKLHLAHFLSLDIESLVDVLACQEDWSRRLALASEGYIIADPVFFQHANVGKSIVVALESPINDPNCDLFRNALSNPFCLDSPVIFMEDSSLIKQDLLSGRNPLEHRLNMFHDNWGNSDLPGKAYAECRYLWIPSVDLTDKIHNTYPTKRLTDGVSVVTPDWRVSPEKHDQDIYPLAGFHIGDGIAWVADYRFDTSELGPSLMLKVLQEAFGSERFIPYDMEVRRQKLAHAYEYLHDYLP